jgi:hypothetical protein
MKHLSDEELVLIYYNEPGASRDARIHLAQCEHCRAGAASLAETLNLCSEWSVPDVAPGFGKAMWAQLAPRLRNQSHRSWFRPSFPPRALLWAAGIAALMIVAFVAGRSSRNQPARTAFAGLSPQASARILAISLADHFDRAEMLLTEISNISETEQSDLAAARDRAHDLVDEGRLMRQALGKQEDNAVLPLVDQVERFMLEVANTPDPAGAAEIRGLKQQMDSDSLLFKVRIVETNLRNQFPGSAQAAQRGAKPIRNSSVAAARSVSVVRNFLTSAPAAERGAKPIRNSSAAAARSVSVVRNFLTISGQKL